MENLHSFALLRHLFVRALRIPHALCIREFLRKYSVPYVSNFKFWKWVPMLFFCQIVSASLSMCASSFTVTAKVCYFVCFAFVWAPFGFRWNSMKSMEARKQRRETKPKKNEMHNLRAKGIPFRGMNSEFYLQQFASHRGSTRRERSEARESKCGNNNGKNNNISSNKISILNAINYSTFAAFWFQCASASALHAWPTSAAAVRSTDRSFSKPLFVISCARVYVCVRVFVLSR